jgi:hypothetical protein
MDRRPRMLATTGGRLRFVAAAILVVGLVGAIWIYLAAAPPPDDVLSDDPMQSKKYLHDLELYGGKANVLAVQLTQWFDSLWHGTRLAYTVACATVLLAVVFWLAAVASEVSEA